jgi:tetratricopeptide (TPR) repeat protein
MSNDDRTGRWRRHERASTASEGLQLLRRSIIEIRAAPGDPEARRRLRAIAAEQGLWDQLALLLADEARAHADQPAIAAAFYEELADVHETLDQPLETIAAMEALVAIAPEVVDHHDRIAKLYRHEGAWAKAADAFAQVGLRTRDARADAALRAAATIDREHGRLDRAETHLRRIVERRPTDLGAWRALDDVLCELGHWREVADVRGERASRAPTGVEKAAILRAQARALEQAGDLPAAALVVAAASGHAPDHISGLVDQADVLARAGQGREAAAILRTRIAEAQGRGAAPDDVAALRLRLAQILEDDCDDPAGATAVIDQLLAASPVHLPALERQAALAANDPDPRVHAQALLRYAAAIDDDAEQASYVAAAGRRLREAGDLIGAGRALQHAASLVDDEAIRRELDEIRTSSIILAAKADAHAGDRDTAERRLRAILAADRHHVDGNLALADLLAATGRVDAAAEHLRETLATTPDDRPPAATARLVHRYADVTAALGDDDDSHQLLYEAHHLDRSSLAITLALGESCFARKLWRQAALHLGATAAHPDAPLHAAAVAAGLVHAAQAEVRALRAPQAAKHYEAAVRLDPACAAAWHGLAEIATDRGDLVRAAECLEHEANAVTDPAVRLRLYDALGDMALEVLADPARAERCWSRIADAADAAVLDKLLAVQRKRGATIELADTCARLARLAADAAARKALVAEALDALVGGGAVARALELADELLATFPRDPDVVVRATTIALEVGDARAAAWARRLMHKGDAEDHRAGLELVRALGVPLTADDQRFLDEHPPIRMASDEAYAAALDDDDRRELVDDPADRPLRDVLALLGDVLPLVCPTPAAALALAGMPEAQRVPASSEAATASLYPRIARALGGPPTLLFTTPDAAAALELVFASPPVVVIGPALAAVRASSHHDAQLTPDATLRFQLGRIVELSRPHRVFAAMPDDAFALFVAAVRHTFGPPAWTATPVEVVAEAERLHARLPVAVRQRLTERLAAIAPDELDARAYAAACRRAADRAGLLACGDARVAIELAGGAREATHLVQLAATKRYLVARKKLRAR